MSYHHGSNFVIFYSLKNKDMCEGALKQSPDLKNHTAPPVLIFLDLSLIRVLLLYCQHVQCWLPVYFCICLQNLQINAFIISIVTSVGANEIDLVCISAGDISLVKAQV